MITIFGRILCFFGFHTWAPIPGSSSQYCTRPACKIAMRKKGNGWETFTRKEATLEQVQLLNRRERRRLGSLARRGAFGRIPE